jgi:hypothetical protein
LPLLLAGALLLPAADSNPADAAWQRLRSLAGTWEAVEGTFTVVSGGHALLESMKMPAPAPDMVTVYHRDGTTLLATHYCSIGNQPRMRATEFPKDSLSFVFADITNLAKPDAVHIHDLKITFVDADHIVEDWSSAPAGKGESISIKLTRKK